MGTSSEGRDARHENYEKARRDFKDLNLEEQATFWVEATTSLLARGVQEAGRTIAHELDNLFTRTRKARPEAGSGPGPAEPETAQQRAAQGGTTSSEKDDTE